MCSSDLSDRVALLGSRRGAYLLLGALCALAGYAMLAYTVETRSQYLAAMLLTAIGFMIQDVVADALSVEIARDDRELGQIQALGRIALLAGGISVGYLSGWLTEHIGTRAVYAVAGVLPLLVVLSLPVLARKIGRAHV